jgi:hypothetical protein
MTPGRPEELASIRGRSNHQVEAGRVGERPEAPVSRKERNPAIDAALSDQGIAEARLTEPCQHVRPQSGCPLPVASLGLDDREF